MVFKKIKNTNCTFLNCPFSSDFIHRNKWKKVNHDEFFSILKNSSIVHFTTDHRVNICYIIFWFNHFDHYVLDAKEYKMFLYKYCNIENIIDWKKDGF